MISINVSRKLAGANGLLQLNLQTTILKNEMVTLYGPTGAGKSSILRMLAGLMDPEDGIIQVENEIWFDKKTKINIPPQRRNIGMVFQDYSLFPNMTVRQNLDYALSSQEDHHVVDELIEIAGLKNLQDKYPIILSGGQKQRVALARALVRKPRVLLLDEPLSALDTEMRRKLQDYILQFHQIFNLTTILVSHDLQEVLKMSKRVIVLENGSVRHDCSPQELMELSKALDQD